jgi:Protein of unknown function (DUF3551)
LETTKESQMRNLFLAVAGATALIVLALPAQAQYGNGSWCTEGPIGSWGFPDCSYHNQAQCLATASGTRAHCTTNPYYQPVRPAPRHRTRRHKPVHQ